MHLKTDEKKENQETALQITTYPERIKMERGKPTEF
jgi:hypothetical protein